MHLPLSVLSSVCLRTSNGLSMGEFDKCLMYTSFSDYFASFLGELCAQCYYLYSYSQFMLFDMICRILGIFTQYLTLNRCTLTSPMDTYVLLRLRNKKRAQNRFQTRPRSDRGEQRRCCLFIFLQLCGQKHPGFPIKRLHSSRIKESICIASKNLSLIHI